MSTPNSKFNAQIYQEACEWLIAFRTDGAGAAIRRGLDTWLRKSPEHVRAYLEVSAIWEDASLHDPQRSVSAEAHIVRARAEDNVVCLTPADTLVSVTASGPMQPAATAPHGAPASPTTSPSRARPLLLATAAAVLLLLGAVGTRLYLQRDIYATAIGEQRSIALTDGSIVELNARSRIKAHLSRTGREVDLVEGQALFQVAHDPTRPFIVRSGTVVVQAVGTQFDVYRKSEGTTVTVIEGRVMVGNRDSLTPAAVNSAAASPARQSSAPQAGSRAAWAEHAEPHTRGSPGLLLVAGEQVTVLPEALPQPTRANIAAVTAWTQRRLVFDSVPLSEVVVEFNRYNTRPLIIDDPGLRNLAVMGVFSSTDPSSLLRFLRAQPGVLVTEDESEVRITRK